MNRIKANYKSKSNARKYVKTPARFFFHLSSTVCHIINVLYFNFAFRTSRGFNNNMAAIPQSSLKFIDLNEVVKKWAWTEYKVEESPRQKSLKKKEEHNKGKHIDLLVDWSSMEFRDETEWMSITDDTSDDDTSGGDAKTVSTVTKHALMKSLVPFETNFETIHQTLRSTQSELKRRSGRPLSRH